MKPTLEKAAVIETSNPQEADRILNLIMDTGDYEACIEYAEEEGVFVIILLRKVNY